MTEKKQVKVVEQREEAKEAMETEAGMVTEVEETVSRAEYDELVQALEEAKKEAEDLKNKWLRAVADLRNARKRHERERSEWIRLANETLILKLLPILDDFEMAFANLPPDQSEQEEKWVEGFRLIHKKLAALLESEGLKVVPAEGEAFDHNLHQAVSYEQAEGFSEGEIIAELRKGYMLGDKVIRPALVRVAQ